MEAPFLISLHNEIPDFNDETSAMIASEASLATSLGQPAARKSPATSVFQKGASARIAGPVHPPEPSNKKKTREREKSKHDQEEVIHVPTRRCAVASRLQKVLSQISRERFSFVSDD